MSSKRPEGQRGQGDPAWLVEAVTGMQQGDAREESYQRIFEHYLPLAYRFFLRRGFGEQVADDLAQESMWRVYNGIDGFRRQAAVNTWILQIMSNVAKNRQRHMRTAARRAESESVEGLLEAHAAGESAELPAGLSSQTPDPQTATLAGEREQQLERAVGELPPRMRQCFLLRFQGFKYREIAVMLDVKVDTVKKQLAESRRRLGVALGAAAGLFSLILFHLFVRPGG